MALPLLNLSHVIVKYKISTTINDPQIMQKIVALKMQELIVTLPFQDATSLFISMQVDKMVKKLVLSYCEAGKLPLTCCLNQGIQL